MREYPDPDPFLRYISREASPGSFWTLPPRERSYRGRYFLIATSAGFPDMVAWMMSLVTEGPNEQWEHIVATVDEVSDDRLREMLTERAENQRLAMEP